MSVVTTTSSGLSGPDIQNLESLYEAANGVNFTPGWVPRKKPILWNEPRPEYVPAHWSYDDAKAGLDAAGRLIDASLAERRNLVMRNPAPGSNFETTRTLVCAYQMILPGEKAPSHRHSSHALRVIINGKGSFSTVNGEKMPMETGDVVLTPGWCWHGHGHDGDRPAYWFDGLDVPLTHLLEPMFYQEHPERHEKVERVVQVRDIAEIPAAFAGRIRDGFLYGDFQYSIDESSDGFLRRGVFSCYRPVPDSTPIPGAPGRPSDGSPRSAMKSGTSSGGIP